MASIFQYKGTRQGMFFEPESMYPLVNNVGMAWVMDVARGLMSFGPPGQHEVDSSMNIEYFKNGRCFLTLHWGALFKRIGKSPFAAKMGVTQLPGSRFVYDRDLDNFVRCDAERCQFGRPDDGGDVINYAPYVQFRGLLGGVSSFSPKNARKVQHKMQVLCFKVRSALIANQI